MGATKTTWTSLGNWLETPKSTTAGMAWLPLVAGTKLTLFGASCVSSSHMDLLGCMGALYKNWMWLKFYSSQTGRN